MQHSSKNKIIEYLNAFYGVKATSLAELPLGADRNASVYKVESDQGNFFVKLKRGHQEDIGIAILALLRERGVERIIFPIETSQGQLTQQIEGFTLVVYPFIEHQNGFSQTLTRDQWMTLGKTMRKIHELKLPPEIQNQIRGDSYSPEKRNFVRSLYNRIEAEPTGDEVAKKLLTFMKERKEEIQRLVDAADLLGQKMHEKSAEFVLCHGDIHGGNVMIKTDGSIYIVDWDDPIMAPKERDLMFIGGGVANVWNQQHEQEYFYKGYGETEIDMSILAYYRHERIVEDIAEYAQGLLMTTSGGESRLEMYQHFTAMFAPRGVVDIAFKTS